MAKLSLRDLISRNSKKEEPVAVSNPSLESSVASNPAAAPHAHSNARSEEYIALKNKIHLQILEQADLTALETMGEMQLRAEITSLVELFLKENPAQINTLERHALIRDIQHEMLGLGPLEILMADPAVSDILINSYDQIYVERRGRLELTDVTFNDENHLMRIIEKIVSRVGRRIDESSPMVDARLPDGSRVNVVIPPIALDGAMMSIRRFSAVPLKMENLVHNYKSLTPDMALLLEGLAKSKTNMIVSGGTGSGKTTLLNILSGYIPAYERIITIEDAAELQLQQPHVIRMETRPANIEGKGEVPSRALVKNALRMRPDRVVIGEVRGGEAVDMLQAMNTGHEGSMATIHANTPRDAVSRLESMISMAGLSLPHRVVRHQIASAVNVIVQANRLSDGQRKITSILEITGMEGEVITMQEIFVYVQTGVDENGRVQGYFQATGVKPKFADRLRSQGVILSDAMFDANHRFE